MATPRQEKTQLIGQLNKARSALEELLSKAKVQSEKDLDAFISKPGPHLGPAIVVYAQLISGIDKKRYADVTDSCKRYYSDAAVRDAADDFIAAEDEWDAFLDSLDCAVSGSSLSFASLKAGDVMPDADATVDAVAMDQEPIWLTDVRSGETVRLQELVATQQQRFLHLVLLRHLA